MSQRRLWPPPSLTGELVEDAVIQVAVVVPAGAAELDGVENLNRPPPWYRRKSARFPRTTKSARIVMAATSASGFSQGTVQME